MSMICYNAFNRLKTKKLDFLIINAFMPIVLGGLIYYLISPDVVFVKNIDAFLDWDRHLDSIMAGSIMMKFVRNYLLDMMWAYAFVFTLFFIMGNKTAELLKILTITTVFSAGIEILQLTPFVRGTFDILDIIAEFFAGIAAGFIIKYNFHKEEKRRYETNI